MNKIDLPAPRLRQAGKLTAGKQNELCNAIDEIVANLSACGHAQADIEGNK